MTTPGYGAAANPHLNAGVAPQAYFGYQQPAPTFEEIWHANATKAASGPFKFYAEPPPHMMQNAAAPPAPHHQDPSPRHQHPSPAAMAVQQSPPSEAPLPHDAFTGAAGACHTLEARGLQVPEARIEQAPPAWVFSAAPQLPAEDHFVEQKARDLQVDMSHGSWQLEGNSLPSKPVAEKKLLPAEDAVTAVLKAALTADNFAEMNSTSPVCKDFRAPVVEVRDVDAETKEPFGIAPTVVVQPLAASAERNTLSLPAPAARRRPCHLQILTGGDDLLLTPSPSTRPASATSVTTLDGVFERLHSDSLVASSPSRLSDTGLLEGVVATVPPTQPMEIANRELPTIEDNALRQAAITNPVPIMGRGIVKALPFDADGREQENIFDTFNAQQASVEAAVAAVVPLLNIQGSSPAASSLPPKRASDLWSHGTPVYRSPKAASPVSVATLSSLDSVGRSLHDVPPSLATRGLEDAAAPPTDLDDAASVETVVAPVDPDRLAPAETMHEPEANKDSTDSVQYFDMSPRHGSAAAAAQDASLDKPVPAERPAGIPTVLGSSLSQPAVHSLGAAPFPLFGEDSPNDALGGMPSSPGSPAARHTAPDNDCNSPIMCPPVPAPPEPLPEPKTIWARKDMPAQASTPPKKAPMPWPFDGSTGFCMQSASYDAGTPSNAAEPIAVEISPAPAEPEPLEKGPGAQQEGGERKSQEEGSERRTDTSASKGPGFAMSAPARQLQQEASDAAKPGRCMPRSASAGAVAKQGATQRSSSAVSSREKKPGRLSKAKDSLRKTFHLKR